MTFFTVVGEFSAFVRRTSLDTNNPDPWQQRISALVQFTPSYTGMIQSEENTATYIISPYLGRILDGVLKNIAGIPTNDTLPAELPGQPPNHLRYGVRLVANSDALGPLPELNYRVTFDKVTFGGSQKNKLNPFTFTAPHNDEIIDLATVIRRPTRKQWALSA